MIPFNDDFVLSDALIGGGTGTAKLFGKIEGSAGFIANVMLKTTQGIYQDATLIDENGDWEIKNLPAGTYSLDLDAQNIFEDNGYIFDNDGKISSITLLDSQVLEVDAKVKKM